MAEFIRWRRHGNQLRWISWLPWRRRSGSW